MRKQLDPVVIYARGFVQSFGTDCGTRLEAIAREIGLTIEEIAASSVDGALVRVAGRPCGTVVLNSDIREEGRRLFTLAHEIGHYVLPTHSKQGASCRAHDVQNWAPGLPVRELEANSFAAEILMPWEGMIDLLKEEPSFRVIRSVAGRFHTSLTASAYRLVELSSYRIAMVWSTAGRRSWYKTSEEFGRAVELGPVSPESFAADCFRAEVVPDHPEPVPATAWLYENGLAEGARIWEESVPIPCYESVLTLLYIRETIEAAEETAEEEAELDPTEFTLARTRWPKK
jgi:hypothetical protein